MMKIKSFTAAIILSFAFSVIANGQTLTDAQKAEIRIDQIIARSEDHFRKGKLALQDNKREQARDEFDKAVDSILESGLDVRTNPRLQTFYLELVERIYLERVFPIGFRQQAFEPSPLDALSKLILTPEELTISPVNIYGLQTRYDRFEDKTTVLTPYDYVYVKNLTLQKLSVMAFFTYRGKAAGGPVERVGLVFDSITSSWTYLRNNKLIAIIDGERVLIGQPFAKDQDTLSTGGVNERFEFKAPYGLLKKIANAREVEMRLGPAEFNLNPGFFRSVKTLIANLPLTTSRRLKSK